MDFVHLLPDKVETVSDRQEFITNSCIRKNVLHLGCVDAGLTEEAIKKGNFLQSKIAKVANKVIGVDSDDKGLAFLEDQKNTREEFIKINIEKINELIIDEKIDVVIAGEILEHLSNPGSFLQGIRELLLKHNAEMIITVPNAYSIRHIKFLESGREIVHPDHNYYFSYATLKTLIEKYSMTVKEVHVCNTPFPVKTDSLYSTIRQLLIRYNIRRQIKRSPFYSEGIIFVIEAE